MRKTNVLQTLVIAALLALSTSLSAAIKQPMIEQMITDIWRVQADFHMFAVMNGSAKYRKQMEDSISRGKKTLQAMRESAESEAGRALVSDLEQTWSKFAKLARANKVAEQGHPGPYTLPHMADTGQSMIKKLNQTKVAQEGKFADIIALGGDLQHIAAEYLRMAAAPDGGKASGGGERLSFEKAVPAFGDRLDKLQKKYSDNETIRRTLSQVELRWRFIRDSLINFSENAVPFLVHRYSHQMTDELELATNLAAGSGAKKPMQGNGPPMPGQGGGEGGR